MNITIRKKANPLAKAFAKSLKSVESQVEMRKLEIVEELLRFMKKQGINRTELAERLGVRPSRITKILSGDENLTIDTLVRAGVAVGADLKQTYVPKGHHAHWVSSSTLKSSEGNCIVIDFNPSKPKPANAPQLENKKPASHDADTAA